MRVQDAGGQQWTVVRRFSSWRRVVQPVAMAVGEYFRYVVRWQLPQPGAIERAKQRRARRRAQQQEKRDQTKITGWKWLLLPFFLIAAVAMGIVGEALQAVQALFHLLIWLILLPFATIELLVRTIVDLGLFLVRLPGLAKSRVDVVAHHANSSYVASLTVVLVPGFGNAGRLATALAGYQQQASRPFDPADPMVGRILTAHRAQVRQHASVWAPSQVIAPRPMAY